MDYLLSWIIWLPIIGMAIIAFIPRDRSKLIKQIAAVVSGAQLLLAIYLWKIFICLWGNHARIHWGNYLPPGKWFAPRNWFAALGNQRFISGKSSIYLWEIINLSLGN